MMKFEPQSTEEPKEEEEESHLYTSTEFMQSLVLHENDDNNNHRPLSNDLQTTASVAIEDNRSELGFTSPQLENPNSPPSLSSFLDPPSYADAMFRSFDASAPSRESFIHITVSDPRKVPESANTLIPGSATYYSYLITTRTNFPEFEGTEFIVRRRFRDVVMLSDRLSEAYRGYFIPVRPDKGVVESQMMQKDEFVEQRRAAVEKYLMKLAGHCVIRRSEEFRVFLEEQGKVMVSRMSNVALREVLMGQGAVEVPREAKGGMDFFRVWRELKQSVSNDWGAAKAEVVEEDREFLERKERLQELEIQLSNVSQQAEALVKAQQDIGETVGELGMAFVKLTKFELEEAVCESQRVRAGDVKNVATAAVKASRLYRELNAQTVKHLDKLHDYLGVMLAVDNAFADRSSALLSVQALSAELSTLHSRIEKLGVASAKIFGGDSSRMRKIEELKESVKATEDAKCAAVKVYEQIKENNRTELARLDRERRADFLSMLKGFVVNQVGYAEKIADVWEKVAEESSQYASTSST